MSAAPSKLARLDNVMRTKYGRGLADILEAPDATAQDDATGRRYYFVTRHDGAAGALIVAPDGVVLAAKPADEVITELMVTQPRDAMDVARALSGGHAPPYQGRTATDAELTSPADLQYWMSPDGVIWTIHACTGGAVAVFEGSREIARVSGGHDPFDLPVPDDVAYLTETILRRLTGRDAPR